MTIYSARSVSYAGTVVCDVTVRNAQEFLPHPGDNITWTVVPATGGDATQSGKLTVGHDGRVVVPGVVFGRPARLKLERNLD
jgi:hypothetical protein